MSYLFSPLSIRSIQLKNRLVVSPMCQYSSNYGFANDWHLAHVGARSVGGAGLIIMEAAAVEPKGRITPFDLGIWKDEHIAELKRVVAFAKSQHTVIGIQLAHAGRKASVTQPWKGGKYISTETSNLGWIPLAPSPIAYSENYGNPVELQIREIQELVNAFAEAAIRVKKAGFEVLEIHAAHGYLIHEFLSPLTNQRNDIYGGSFQNRIRFLIEIVEAVRNVWDVELPLFVRISATDWVEGGWTEEDSIELANILITKNVDLIDCSTGGLMQNAKVPLSPGYQVPFAAIIKKNTGILTSAVGLITTPQQAEDIIANQQADLVMMAREMLRDPNFPLRAAYELKETTVSWPVQYERAKLH